MKVRDPIKLLERGEWSFKRQKGSHRQFKHPSIPTLITVAGHSGEDVPPGTLRKILRDAGLKQSSEDWIEG